jgi:hypothetical protein
MKILLLLFISSLFDLQSFGQYTQIPDPNFEQALIDLGYDTGPKDGWVLTTSIAEVYYLDLNSKSIKSLTGIEDFVKLDRLDCWENELTTLNLSNNLLLTHLECGNNNLSVLDLSHNQKLTWLFCGLNELQYLDISKNIELTHLDCSKNKLRSLDISQNLKLEWVMCASNKLTKIDVSKHLKLNSLQCGKNSLTSIDVSKNTELEYLYCDNNLLTEIDISQNTKLWRINCGGNNIKELDLHDNPKMEDITIYDTYIDQIDLSDKYYLNRIEFSNTPLACLNFGASKSAATEITLLATNTPNLNCIDIGDIKESYFNWLDLDDGITLQKNCIANCSLTVDTTKVTNISIYPNPTNSLLTIDFNGKEVSELKVSLLNIIGQEIKYYKASNVSEFTLEINESSGVYFLQLIADSHSPIIYKVLKY